MPEPDSLSGHALNCVHAGDRTAGAACAAPHAWRRGRRRAPERRALHCAHAGAGEPERRALHCSHGMAARLSRYRYGQSAPA